jgi:hypothetical protein
MIKEMKYKFGDVPTLPQIEKDSLKDMGRHILKKDNTLPYKNGYTITNVYNYKDTFYIFEDDNGDMIIFDTIQDISDNSLDDLKVLYKKIYNSEPIGQEFDDYVVTMKDNFSIYVGNQFPGCVQLFYKKETNTIFIKSIQMRESCMFEKTCSISTSTLFLKVFSFLKDLNFTGDIYLHDNSKVGDKQIPLFLLRIIEGTKNISIFQEYDFEIQSKFTERIECLANLIRARHLTLDEIPAEYIVSLSTMLQYMKNSNYKKTLEKIESTC